MSRSCLNFLRFSQSNAGLYKIIRSCLMSFGLTIPRQQNEILLNERLEKMGHYVPSLNGWNRYQLGHRQVCSSGQTLTRVWRLHGEFWVISLYEVFTAVFAQCVFVPWSPRSTVRGRFNGCCVLLWLLSLLGLVPSIRSRKMLVRLVDVWLQIFTKLFSERCTSHPTVNHIPADLSWLIGPEYICMLVKRIVLSLPR